jgi:ABC-type sugar transport system substrate-binding protein
MRDQEDEIVVDGAERGTRMTRASLFAGAGLGALSLAALGCGAKADEPAAASGGGGMGPKRKIHWAIDQSAAWQIPIDVGFNDAAKLLGWEYKKAAIGAASSSASSQIDAMKRAALAKPDVLVSDWWYKPQGAAFDAIRTDGIFTMVIEADSFPDERKKLGFPYVGVDNYLSGYTLGTRMAEELDKAGKKTGVFVSGIPFPGAVNLEIQDKAIRDALAKHNDEKGTSFRVESFEDKADSNVAQASGLWRAKVKQLGDDFVGGTSGSDNFGTIITDILKTTGKQPGDHVLGAFRSAAGTLKGIRDGWIVAASDQSYYPVGFVSALYAWLWLERGIPVLDYSPGADMIDKSNLELIEKREARIADLAKQYKIKAA